MPDREKYIEVLSKTAKTVKEFNEDAPIKISLECIEDILELLKEQEPVEPEMEGGGGTWWMVCGECHGPIGASDRYCRHCGRRIKQDGHGGADIKEHSEGHGEGDPGGRAGDTDDGRGETDC